MIVLVVLRLRVVQCLSVLFAVALAHGADARVGPGRFIEQEGLALATDIVVVVPVNVAGEPSYRVVDVWRGSLEVDYVFKPGALNLDVGLVSWVNPAFGFLPASGDQETPRVITPTSTVLYLRDSEAVEDDRLNDEQNYGKALSRWLPAHRYWLNSVGHAALYLTNDGKAYELWESMWGGPSVDGFHQTTYSPVSYQSAASYRMHVQQYDLLADWLDKAEEAESIQRVVEIYASAIEQGFDGLISRAHDILTGMGPGVVQPIRHRLLNHLTDAHPGYLKQRSRLLELIVQADRKAAQHDLDRQVEIARNHFGPLIESEAGQERLAWMLNNCAGEDWQQYELLVTALKHLDIATDDQHIELLESVREQWTSEHLQIPEDRRHMGIDVVQQCDILLRRNHE